MRSAARRPITVLTVLLPVLVMLSVWLLVLQHYAVDDVPVSADMVESARHAPSDAVLTELGDFSLLPIENRGRAMEVKVADGILDGQLALPGLSPAPIGLPFEPDDLDGLPPALRLWFAAYTVPDFLLAAYVDTGREEFFAMARDTILAWDDYERSVRLPKGYLWNDHAIAARVRVLGEFWRIYRQRPDYRAEDGLVVLQQAARYRELLSDPGHFTFATNHGLMQNLGLLHLEAAFPTLPDGARYRQLAIDRLGDQLGFLLDEDGVFRENSAGYQGFDLGILAMTFRTMTLLGMPIPEDWTGKYDRGLDFLARLERPGGSLPLVGDTDGGYQGRDLRVTGVDELGMSGALHPREATRPDGPWSVHPAAGYAVEWDGLDDWPEAVGLSQTVVTWTRPPAPSHKHADELSVHVWSKGVDWLTGVGYWPFSDPGWSNAQSWSAANAPHRTGEAPNSDRTARLLSSGRTTEVSALDVERRAPGKYLARREVVHVEPDLWVIVDHVSADTTTGNETVWTIDPAVDIRQADAGTSWTLESANGSAAARLTVAGSPGTIAGAFKGSTSPFAGWTVTGARPQPAPAIRVEQPPGNAWSVTVLSTAALASPQAYDGGEPQMSAGSTADEWTVTLPMGSGELRIAKTEAQIAVERPGADATTSAVELRPAPDVSPELDSIKDAFDRMASAYPVFQERRSARVQTTGALAVLLLAQELFLLLVRRIRPGLVMPIRLLALVCWVAVGAVLWFALLPSWTVLSST